MNIEEYRAMVAAEAESAEADQTATDADQQSETVTESTTDQTTQQEQTQETSTEEVIPDKLIVDGEEITLDDVKEWRKGYMRNSDYTQKTQTVAAQRREAAHAIELFEQFKANPHVAQAILAAEGTPDGIKQVFTPLHPEVQRVSAIEQELFDLKLQREIDDLQKKYPDFDVVEVLNKASEKQLDNLEDAYILARGSKSQSSDSQATPVDRTALEQEIRAQILRDMEAERASTATIISSNDTSTSTQNQTPRLTEAQRAILPKLGMTEEEYIKWMNPNKR